MALSAQAPSSVARRRRRSRKSERGTTVLVVVMVTTLITAIGVFAVRNASQIDRAVGYSRQGNQTIALAELGTSAAIADFGASKAAAYVAQMETKPETCLANAGKAAPCYRLFRADLEAATQQYSSNDLLEATSFGPLSPLFGDLYVEITERGPTGRPVAGTDLGGTGAALKYAKVTLTTTAQIRPAAPDAADNEKCDPGISAVASKKVMRARVVVGPI